MALESGSGSEHARHAREPLQRPDWTALGRGDEGVVVTAETGVGAAAGTAVPSKPLLPMNTERPDAKDSASSASVVSCDASRRRSPSQAMSPGDAGRAHQGERKSALSQTEPHAEVQRTRGQAHGAPERPASKDSRAAKNAGEADEARKPGTGRTDHKRAPRRGSKRRGPGSQDKREAHARD